MPLILLVIVLALLGGFLGDLLEFAFWAIIVLAAIGAALGFVIYRAMSSMRS